METRNPQIPTFSATLAPPPYVSEHSPLRMPDQLVAARHDAAPGPSSTAASAGTAVVPCTASRKHMSAPVLVQAPAPIPRRPLWLVASAAPVLVSRRPAPLQRTDRTIVLDKREPQKVHQRDSKAKRALLDPHLPGLIMRQHCWDGHSE